ncbi:MAG: chorismate synthase, partial [Monoglobaceae bacterium]
MNVWGEKIKLTIFGESHGKGIGIVIDGLPSGFELNLDRVAEQMKRRAPGRNKLSTSRAEADEFQILSGFFNGKTTGTPLTAVIFNTDMRSKDYNPELLRPSHADFTALCKYGESRDYRGGGHFSGRITAPLVFAGAVAEQILEEKGIYTSAHIMQVGSVCDKPFDMVNTHKELLKELSKMDFPVIDGECAEKMKEEIDKYRCDKNSVGGRVEVCICGVEAGIGSPFFGSVESRLASMMFSIPAVKGIEFGLGFDFATADGKTANDEIYIEDDVVIYSIVNSLVEL